ncbi:MAG: S8/S53 family peptidase [Stagnimonas sp.]|nr:S8/S53 family peptidase [Stagnimonas sp.]
MRPLAALPLLLLVLAGCSGSGGDSGAGSGDAKAAPRVVVAVVDSALNPYHEFFYAGSPIYPDSAPASVTPEVLAELGVASANRVRLTRSGDLAADLSTDAAFWNRVERGTPYWFEGSNVVAVSNCEEPFRPLQPQADKNPHGTGTSASMLKANPEAVLLFFEACEMPVGPDAEALEYVLTHPAVDLLSFSYNFGLPTTEPSSYRGVVEFGKLIFQAAGNYPIPVPYQGGAGSWWTIGVSGIDETAKGQTVSAALLPDFVANFTDALPFCMDCETGLLTVSGTSISTPQAAGLASKVLLEARRRLSHSGGIRLDADQAPAMAVAGSRRLSNWDLRRALEQAAYVDYGPDDYTPPAPVADLPPINAIPINPAAPWLQLAWGDLSTDPAKGVVDEALARLGFGIPAREHPAGYCQFMAEQMRTRQAYSDLRGQVTGELVPDPNPYRYCDAAG